MITVISPYSQLELVRAHPFLFAKVFPSIYIQPSIRNLDVSIYCRLTRESRQSVIDGMVQDLFKKMAEGKVACHIDDCSNFQQPYYIICLLSPDTLPVLRHPCTHSGKLRGTTLYGGQDLPA